MHHECNSHLTDDQIIYNLKETLKNPRFIEWNMTSLSHILMIITGINGDDAHALALKLAENFYNWYVGPSNGYWESFYKYRPKGSLEPFPSRFKIRIMIDDSITRYNTIQINNFDD